MYDWHSLVHANCQVKFGDLDGEESKDACPVSYFVLLPLLVPRAADVLFSKAAELMRTRCWEG